VIGRYSGTFLAANDLACYNIIERTRKMVDCRQHLLEHVVVEKEEEEEEEEEARKEIYITPSLF